MTLESLKVVISAETKGLRENINKAKQQLQGMNKSLDATKNKLKSSFSGKEINNLSQKYARQLENIKRQQIEVDKLRQKYEKLTSGKSKPKNITAMEKELGKVTKELDKAVEKNISLGQSMDALKADAALEKQAGGNYTPETGRKMSELHSDLEQSETVIENLRAKAERLQKSLSDAKLNPNQNEEVQELAKKLDLATDKLERLKNEAGATKGKLTELGTGETFAGFQNSVKKVGSGLFQRVSKFAKRIKNVIAGALVFNAVSRSFTALREYISYVIKSNNQLTDSLAKVKGNLLTAFQPIFSAVAPALQNLMNWLAQATAQVAAFISALFGQTYAQSQTAAKSLDEQVDRMKKVKSMMSFDELNVISRTDDDKNKVKPDFSMEIDTSKSEGIAEKVKNSFAGLEPFFEGLKYVLDGFSKTIRRFYDTYLYKWLVNVGNWLKENPETAKKIGEIAGKITILGIAFKGLKWLGEVTGISKLVSWLFELAKKSDLVTSAFQRKNKSLEEQTEKTGLETAKVLTLSGAFATALAGIEALKRWLDSNPVKIPDFEFPAPEWLPVLQPVFQEVNTWLELNKLSIPAFTLPELTLIPVLTTAFAAATVFLLNNVLRIPNFEMPNINILDTIKIAISAAQMWLTTQTFALPSFDTSALQGVISAINGAFDSIKNSISDIINSIGHTIAGLGEKVGSACSKMASGFTALVSAIVIGVAAIAAAIAAANAISSGSVGAIISTVFGGGNLATSAIKGVGAISVGAFASGGFPKTGELFVAREAGPEMVGAINGKTAVANNSQIVSAVSTGVAKAVSNVIGTGGSTDVSGTFKIKGDDLVYIIDTARKKKGTTISNNFAYGGR